MKRLLLWVLPLLIAIPVFIGTVVILNQKTGKGALQVTSVPGGQVYINSKLIGKTPLCKSEQQDMLGIGDYTIRMGPTEGDFLPFEQTITINKSVLTVVDRIYALGASSEGSIINLVSLDDKKIAQLLVISFPDKAQMLLDNSPSGTTPALTKDITSSDHTLTLKKEGYREKVIRIRTTKGYKLTSIVYLGVLEIVASQSAQPQASASAAPSVTKILILNTPTGFLRVRDDASLNGAEIARVNPGDTFDLVDEKSGWFEIKLKDGKTGWISSDYAKKQ